MARAWFTRRDDYARADGETAFEFGTDALEAEPYAGPLRCEWCNLDFNEEGGGFDWRTGADKVREAGCRVLSGEWTLAQARRDDDVAGWLDSHHRQDGDEASEKRLLAEVGGGVIDPGKRDGPFAFYPLDGDIHVFDAAHTLPLPPWARLVCESAGGVGSGYDTWFLVLPVGKTPIDLQEWLTETPKVPDQRPVQRVDFLPADALRLPGRLGLTAAPGTRDGWRLQGRRVFEEDVEGDLLSLVEKHRVAVLVTLQESGELRRLGLQTLGERVQGHGMRSLWLPVPDCEAPKRIADAVPLVEEIAASLGRGLCVVIHCLGGLGRSGTVAACVLVHLGATPSDAIRRVREARRGAIQTGKQEDFIARFAQQEREHG